MLTTGSSPLTRGKPDWRRVRRVDDRLIPAQAGKTRRRRAPSSASPAHPRSRRENLAYQIGELYWFGSSPLTQGKRRRASSEIRVDGLIPAHERKTSTRGNCPSATWDHPRSAGKTWCASARPQRSRVHPRSRRENVSIVSPPSLSAGSSPLTRGKRVAFLTSPYGVGLIPAHAGKTLYSRRAWARPWAHPHSRGDNFWILPLAPGIAGSSPLTQGKRVSLRHVPVTTGLIPAHAGKTRSWLARSGRSWAHPRSREGKLKQNSYRIHDVRFIPAHAGKTNRPSRRSRCHRAHPHSRGENSGDTAKSSPT